MTSSDGAEVVLLITGPILGGLLGMLVTGSVFEISRAEDYTTTCAPLVGAINDSACQCATSEGFKPVKETFLEGHYPALLNP